MPVLPRRAAVAATVCALALMGLQSAGAASGERPGIPGGLCAAEPAAAARLVSRAVVGTPVRARAGGLPVAVVTDPVVPPGVPHALVETPAGLCTTDAFNLTVAGGLRGRLAVATAFASTAGMPWLGGVEVRDAAVRGDTVRLTTVGGRHAVTSRWTIAVDAAGVSRAAFETVAFGVDPRGTDVHALEGITSLPGNRRSWSRDAVGVLHVDATVRDDLAAATADRDAAAARAAAAAGLAPGDLLEHDVAGQVVRFTLGVAAPGVEAPATGQALADRLLYVHEGMGRIYAQYRQWGLTDVWGSSARTLAGRSTVVPDPVGYINFNSGMSEVCLACAYLGDFIEIHVNLNFAEVTEAEAVLGVDYPDDNSYTLEVVGHEFTHAVQGGYGDGNVGLTNAFYEATATASQALYHEAENSAQRGSIEFLDNSNGCEGFENRQGNWISAQAQGPFVNHTYDACYFWWTYLAQHGGEGLLRLMKSLPGVRARGGDSLEKHIAHLDLASPQGDGTPDLARWAAAYTAGGHADGYEIRDGSGDVHDWFTLLTPAERSLRLDSGTARTVTVKDGGTAGFLVTAAGTLDALPPGAEAYSFRVTDGRIEPLGRVRVGSALGEATLLAVVAPQKGPADGTVALR